jgi:hypothetical protein
MKSLKNVKRSDAIPISVSLDAASSVDALEFASLQDRSEEQLLNGLPDFPSSQLTHLGFALSY